MKKFIILTICLLSCFVVHAQLRTTKQIEAKTVIAKVNNTIFLKDPELGYVLSVKGTTICYLIELGKTIESAKETLSDLINIGNNGLFTECTMWNFTMYIYGDTLTNNKKVVRFKDPTLNGSVYISVENLEKFKYGSTNKQIN